MKIELEKAQIELQHYLNDFTISPMGITTELMYASIPNVGLAKNYRILDLQCFQCGSIISQNDIFCPKCGIAIIEHRQDIFSTSQMLN